MWRDSTNFQVNITFSKENDCKSNRTFSITPPGEIELFVMHRLQPWHGCFRLASTIDCLCAKENQKDSQVR
jgi:hypothetical protein